MANVFRYLTGNPTRKALKKGNLVRGIGGQEYGPSSATGYYAGVNPPDGEFIVTTLRADNTPDYRSSPTEEGLITIANELGGNVTTVNDAKVYLAGRSHTWFANRPPENQTTDGLTTYIDASNVASYPGTGTTAYDLSGNGRDWSINGGTTWNSDGWWELDGTNDYLQLSNLGVNPDTSDTTIEVIFSPSRLNVDQAVFSDNWGPEYGIWTRSNGNIQFTAYASRQTSGTVDKWYHAVLTVSPGATKNSNDQTVIKSYLNGEYLGENSANTGNGLNDTPFSLGRDPRSAAYFQGKIASLKVYNRQLSADEVKTNFHKGGILTKTSDTLRHFSDTGNLRGRLDGTTLPDLSGVSSDFTTEGTVTHDDSYGGVLHLNSGRIYRSQLGWYGKMATSWWMKYDGNVSSGNFYMESNRGPSGCSRIYSYLQSDGKFVFRVWDNSSNSAGIGGSRTATTTTNVCDGNWHHITCQWSNGTGNQSRGMYVYVNGELEGYTDAVGNDGGYEHWHLGGSYGCAGTKAHNCYIGPIMFYKNYNLTNEEVVQNYNAHKGRFGR